MIIGEFDAVMQNAADIRKHGREMLSIAEKIERQALDSAGIIYIDREAGFPCWSNGDGRYYSTPREALIALVARNKG